MQRENVKQIIESLFTDAYASCPELYPPDAGDGLINDESDDLVQRWAVNVWNERTDEEIERDEDLAIILKDYKDWALQKFFALRSN